MFFGLYRNHPVRQSVHMSCKHNSRVTDGPILMKHYTVAVYNLRICMKEDNRGLKYFKGEH